MAATGPKVIQIAARLADQVTFAVGADPGAPALGHRPRASARAAAGLDPDDLGLGAYVNVVVHDDPEEAPRLGEAGLSLFARFVAMHGTPIGPTSETERRVMQGIHDAYDMTSHSRTGSPQAAVLTGEFAREYGIFGAAGYCVERLAELVALGITRLVIVGPSRDAEPADIDRAEAQFLEAVAPAVRKTAA